MLKQVLVKISDWKPDLSLFRLLNSLTYIYLNLSCHLLTPENVNIVLDFVFIAIWLVEIILHQTMVVNGYNFVAASCK